MADHLLKEFSSEFGDRLGSLFLLCFVVCSSLEIRLVLWLDRISLLYTLAYFNKLVNVQKKKIIFKFFNLDFLKKRMSNN